MSHQFPFDVLGTAIHSPQQLTEVLNHVWGCVGTDEFLSQIINVFELRCGEFGRMEHEATSRDARQSWRRCAESMKRIADAIYTIQQENAK